MRVRTHLPGRVSGRSGSAISHPIEEVVNTVEGITELRSITGPGTSFIIVTFDLNRDIDTAAQDVRDRVATVFATCRANAIRRSSPSSTTTGPPFSTIALSGQRIIRELTEFGDKIVKVQLERSAGVSAKSARRRPETRDQCLGRCGSTGRLPNSNHRRSRSHLPGRTPMFRAATSPASAGTVCAPWAASPIRTQFNDLVVANRQWSPIRIRDIGWAEDGTKEQRSVARLNGVPTVSLEFAANPAPTPSPSSRRSRHNCQRVRRKLPADVKLEVIRDQSRYIYEALHEIKRHLILGSILACLVVLAVHAQLARHLHRGRRDSHCR